MVAILSKAVLVEDAIAYQDSENQNLFFYLPIVCVGKNLEDFKFTYWGYGKQFLAQKDGRVESVIGSVITGRTEIDMDTVQKQKLIEQIRKVFAVKNPELKAIALHNVMVEPVVGSYTFKDNADTIFPEILQLGTNFHFLVGSGNILFAKFASWQKRIPIEEHPSLGINIVGFAEFQAEPWEVEVTTDLSQVWNYVRKRVASDISCEWQELKYADYKNIITEMHRDRIIKLAFKQGSFHSEKFGQQILEMGKHIFAAINNQASSQLGYFKFEPNPKPQPVQTATTPSWLWKCFINLAYGEKSIKSSPSLNYKSTISYTDSFLLPLPISLVLDIKCNTNTAEQFQDLGNPHQPCMTSDKIEELQKRLKDELRKQTQLASNLYKRLITGEITQQKYDQTMNTILTGK